MIVRHIWFAALATLFVGTSAAPAQVLSYDFEIRPFDQGWYHLGDEGWTTEQSRSPTHSFRVNWYFGSPFINQPDGQFMVMDFHTMNATATSTAEFAFGFHPLRTGTGWQSNSFVFRARGYPTGDRSAVWGGNVYVDDVTIRPVTRPQAAAIQDANVAHFMPGSITYSPPADRQVRIPNAINRLSNGQALNALMVGDSIVHDTYSSYFEARVDRRYPTGARLSVRELVGNGTGASYWSQNNRIRDQVMALNPQLLMFGGISTPQFDIPLIGEIVRQARQVNPGIEIVLMSPIAGDIYNPYTNPSLTQQFDPVNGTDYRATLYRLAQDLGVQFWDLTTPWSRFIVESGLPYDYYLRDGLHMNGYGNMLAGRIMDLYFAPVPEPGTLVLTGAAAIVGGWWIRRRRTPPVVL